MSNFDEPSTCHSTMEQDFDLSKWETPATKTNLNPECSENSHLMMAPSKLKLNHEFNQRTQNT